MLVLKHENHISEDTEGVLGEAPGRSATIAGMVCGSEDVQVEISI